MTPKFAVGEVVLLRSTSRPHLNGEYTISQIRFGGKSCKDKFYPGGIVKVPNDFGLGYVLEEIAENAFTTHGNPCECSWVESALRKKHDPSQYNFYELMDNIKDMATA